MTNLVQERKIFSVDTNNPTGEVQVRKIFSVDLGDMPVDKASELMKEAMNEFREDNNKDV